MPGYQIDKEQPRCGLQGYTPPSEGREGKSFVRSDPIRAFATTVKAAQPRRTDAKEDRRFKDVEGSRLLSPRDIDASSQSLQRRTLSVLEM
ncbi:MAG: hypothetical protein M4579_003570 [Chaenotheca gracillima]|nr:MAG: hypothetical protein M4579_003570 [Chaenotheca gracillima]